MPLKLSERASGGGIGSATYTAGDSGNEGTNVVLGENGKVYSVKTSHDAVGLTTLARNYENNQGSTYKSVECSTDNIVTVGHLQGVTNIDTYLFASTALNNVLINKDIEQKIWDEGIDGKSISFDLTNVNSGNNMFATAIFRDGDAQSVHLRVGKFDGVSFTLGSFVSSGIVADNYNGSLIDAGINGGNNEYAVSFGQTDKLAHRVLKWGGLIDSTTIAYNSAVTITALTNRIDPSIVNKQDPFVTNRDGYGMLVTTPELDGDYHEISFIDIQSMTVSMPPVALDTDRNYSGNKPVGAYADSPQNFLVAAISDWDFLKDLEGFTGVTNPVEQISGKVLSVYAVTATTSGHAAVVIGTPLKLDPLVNDTSAGVSPINIIKDVEGNYEVIYQGYIHKVSVDFNTNTVTKIWTGRSKKHDSSIFGFQGFEGSCFNGSISSLVSINPVSGGRFIYSDNSQSAGAIQLYPETFLSAGRFMPLGQAASAFVTDDNVTVYLDPRLKDRTTGGIYTTGETVASWIEGGDVISTIRALTPTTVVEELPEFQINKKTPSRSRMKVLPPQEYGFSLAAANNSEVLVGAGVASFPLNGIQPLQTVLNLQGAGRINLLTMQNFVTPTNIPDFDIVKDGELYAQNRGESLSLAIGGTGNISIFTGSRDRVTGKLLEGQGIEFERSLLIKVRNKQGVALTENISIFLNILVER